MSTDDTPQLLYERLASIEPIQAEVQALEKTQALVILLEVCGTLKRAVWYFEEGDVVL